MRHQCINYRQATRGGLYRWEFQRGGEEFEIAVSGRLIVNEAELLVRAAMDGVGLAYHLESVVQERLERGEVVEVLGDFSVATPGFFLYFPARAQVLPKLRAFLNFTASS
jgi:DNA-binding transcriptional LysR family regulator